MAGPVTITCRGCGDVFPVPTRVVRVFGHEVLVVMDRSGVYGHMAACPGFAEPGSPAPVQEVSKAVETPGKPNPNPELAGRIHQMLAGGHFMSKGGSGACTMCGAGRDACLRLLNVKATHRPCCAACGNGNTHPAPMESRGTCAEWGAEHGAQN